MKISKNNFENLSIQDSMFYYANKYTSSLHIFEFNDLTLVQLRNAGGYSLIKTENVADSIALYESKNNDIKLQEKFVIDYYVQTWNSLKLVFDETATNIFFYSFEINRKIPSDKYILISNDKEKIYLMYNNYWTYTNALVGYIDKLKEHLKYLKGFSKFLKRTYDIK